MVISGRLIVHAPVQIAVPVGIAQCEENWAWLVAAVDGATCHCSEAQRAPRPFRPATDQTLRNGGLATMQSRNLSWQETAIWGAFPYHW